MSSKILLVNFGYAEQEKIARLGVDVDLGFLSNAWNLSESYEDKAKSLTQRASFYSPVAIYEYRVVIIRLTKTPPLATYFGGKAKTIDERDRSNFFDYWYKGLGVLIVISDESDFLNLNILGLPLTYLENSSGNDATVIGYSRNPTEELKKALESIRSLIVIPPAKYIIVSKSKSEYNAKRWTIYTPYNNRNNDSIGVYLNWGFDYEDREETAFLILPAFRDHGLVIEKLLKAFSKIYPKLLPEISNLDWLHNDKFYPKEVTKIKETMEEIISDTEKKLEFLKEEKKKAKEKYGYLNQLLTESGDDLKNAVAKTFNDIFDFEVEDLDKDKKNGFREDLTIENEEKRFVEVKGTRNQNPTLTYVVQLQNNLLKRKESYEKGVLVLNHDLTKNPVDRLDAYMEDEEAEAIKNITYIDTRVLFDLALAVIDLGMPKKEARGILFGTGRISFKEEDISQSVQENPRPIGAS